MLRLVIVDIVHLNRMPRVEAKGHAKILSNPNCVAPRGLSFEWVKSQSRRIHLPRVCRSIQHGQNKLEADDVLRLKLARAAGLKKLGKTLVPDCPSVDDWRSKARPQG